MKHVIGAFFSCCVLLGILGGCSGGSNSGEPLSFSAQIQKAEKQNDPNLRARQLIRIAIDQTRAKDLSGAAGTLRLARSACRKISEPVTRAYVYEYLILADALLDDKSAARQDFQAAWKVVESIEEKDPKARAMARLGQMQGKIKDDVDQAADTIRRAEKLAGELPDPFTRGLALITVAQAFGKIGKTEEADRVIAQIFQTARAAPPGRSHVQLLARTGLLLHVLKRPDEENKAFDRAVEAAEKLDNFHFKANALADVAEELRKTGNVKRAAQLLDQAENATAKIPQRDLQQQTLYRVHILMGKLPKSE